MDNSILETGRRKRKSRGRGLRKTTGCLTCRRRHLKCDETKPSCGPCLRSNQNCLYAAPTILKNSQDRDAATYSEPIPAETEDREAGDTDQAGQWHSRGKETYESQTLDPRFRGWNGTNPDHERTQAASGLMHLNLGPSSIEPSKISSPNATVNYLHSSVTHSDDFTAYPAITPPGTAFLRWFELLKSDASQVAGIPRFGSKVDGLPHGPISTNFQGTYAVSPQTTNDYSNSRVSISADRTASSTLQDNPSYLPAFSQAPQRQPWQGSGPSQLLVHEQAIFANFVKNISSWIDLFDPAMQFSTIVSHLAIQDAGLMNAILALSCRHRSLQSDANDEERNRTVAMQYYYNTLHYLQKTMQFDTYTVSLELLATALIVSTYEMLDDFGSGWERHLQGVFWIQQSQLIQGESGGLKQAVWWAWLRQDVWAAFRERRKTFSSWKPTRAYQDMTAYQIASRSVWLFAQAVDYCSTEDIKAGEVNLQVRIEKAAIIMGMLDEWQRNTTIEFQPLPSNSNINNNNNNRVIFDQIWIHPPAFGVALQLYYSARILILLHRPSLGGMRNYMEQRCLLEKSVEAICGIAMALTDDASSLISSQCLFVAGLCTQDARKRTGIIELIDTCQKRTGWPRRSLGEDLMIEWEKSDLK